MQNISLLALVTTGLVAWRNIPPWRERAVGLSIWCYHLGIPLCGMDLLTFLGHWQHFGYRFKAGLQFQADAPEEKAARLAKVLPPLAPVVFEGIRTR